jgi:glycosyltransferase involved in cell wall biosynthesis
VGRRVWKTYRRRAQVVYPPVAVETFYGRRSEDYCLIVSELVPYKRLDYAVRLFASTGRKLKVVGDGPQFRALRRLGGRTTEFCGRVSDCDLRELYAHCDAFLMPGEEDFGIAMVEALASGKPVIALGSGGALEIVTDGCGLLYAEPTEGCLAEGLRAFDRGMAFDPARLQSRAAEFSESEFQNGFLRSLGRQWSRFQIAQSFERMKALP